MLKKTFKMLKMSHSLEVLNYLISKNLTFSHKKNEMELCEVSYITWDGEKYVSKVQNMSVAFIWSSKHLCHSSETHIFSTMVENKTKLWSSLHIQRKRGNKNLLISKNVLLLLEKEWYFRQWLQEHGK